MLFYTEEHVSSLSHTGKVVPLNFFARPEDHLINLPSLCYRPGILTSSA